MIADASAKTLITIASAVTQFMTANQGYHSGEGIVISFLVAKVSYEYFESRFMRKKRYFEYDDEKAAKGSRTYNVG